MNVVLAMFPESSSQKNVVKYYPLVEDALNRAGLGVRHKLVAYATVRAESSGFVPIDEGVNRLNTLMPVDTGKLNLSRNMQDLAAVSKALVSTYELDNPYGLYDYRNRGSLGNNAKGDGDAYHGRGFVQLTGKWNYVDMSKRLNLPKLATTPKIANEPEHAARILAGFMKRERKKIDKALATGDLAAARAAVNGGSHGLDRFLEAYDIGSRLAMPRDPRDLSNAV